MFFLCSSQKLHRDSELKDISGKPMKALDVFSLSILFMKTRILEELKRKFISIGIYEEDIAIVLTVPAIWGDAGKMFMQQAAFQVR